MKVELRVELKRAESDPGRQKISGRHRSNFVPDQTWVSLSSTFAFVANRSRTFP